MNYSCIVFSEGTIIIATSLVWLKGCVECAVVLTDWAAKGAASGRVGRHLQQVGPRRVVRVNLEYMWKHRRGMYTEEKAKVVTAALGTDWIHCHAALAILHQDDLKNGMIRSILR